MGDGTLCGHPRRVRSFVLSTYPLEQRRPSAANALSLLRDSQRLRETGARGRLRTQLQRLRYLVRCMSLPRPHLRWLRFALTDARMRAIVASDPSLIERHFRTYLCRGLSRRERLARVDSHYRFASAAFPPALLAAVYLDGGHRLGTLTVKGDAPLTLSLRPPVRYGRESELGICLEDAAGQVLSSLYFVVGPDATRIEIGCLQGAEAGLGKEAVRNATKACHGLRPKNLLLSMLYAFAAHYGIVDLRGIGNRHHPFAPRPSRRGRRQIRADYDEFWISAGGTFDDAGMFRLPANESVRDEADVESRKRAEFRRREQLRAAACQLLIAALAGEPEPDSTIPA